MGTVNSHMARYYNRKANGLCVFCGKPAEPTKVRCKDCHAKEVNAYRAKKSRSCCISCGVATDGRVRCRSCNSQTRALANQRIAKFRELGLCCGCGGEKGDDRWYCAECLERRKFLRQKLIDSGRCDKCRKPHEGKFTSCDDCRIKSRSSANALKIEVFKHYGGVECRCCGETALVFLTIDHLNNQGGKHRRIEPGSRKLYRWLKRNGFPQGYQVLCMNCNWAKRFGECPHKVRANNG